MGRIPLLSFLAVIAALRADPCFPAATWCVDSAGLFQTVLNAAEQNGVDDEIMLQRGRYAINGNFTYSTTENKGLKITGGYAPGCGSRDPNPATTVLDGVGAGRVLLVAAKEAPQADFLLEGVSLINGDASSVGDGGGLLVETEGGVALLQNRFANNFAEESGGGVRIRVDGQRPIVIVSNAFVDNEAAERGGGLSLNTEHTRGKANILLRDSEFRKNRAQNEGGGLHVNGDSSRIDLDSNRFAGNASGTDGGGAYMALRSNTDELVLTNNLVHDNLARWSGGGLHLWFRGGEGAAYLINNSITANEITGDDENDSHSGGVYLKLHDDETSAYLYNNIIWGNVDHQDLRVSDLGVFNDANGNRLRSVVEIANNNFDQSATGFFATISIGLGTTNLDNADPLFIDPVAGNLQLGSGSPVVDQGDGSAPELPTADVDGNARTGGSAPDMGAFEHLGAQTHFALRVDVSGGGLVVSTPAGIDCGGDCKHSYPQGTAVELTVNPPLGLSFTGWGGSCVGTGACGITINSDKAVTASFADTIGNLNLDVDENGTADALTDGMLVLRYLFGYRGQTLIDGTLAPDANRDTAAEIEAYLGGVMP